MRTAVRNGGKKETNASAASICEVVESRPTSDVPESLPAPIPVNSDCRTASVTNRGARSSGCTTDKFNDAATCILTHFRDGDLGLLWSCRT